MMFRDEFPSLKGKYALDSATGDLCIYSEYLRDFCLDKQRVKEAIDHMWIFKNKMNLTDDESEVIASFIASYTIAIEKELGLDSDKVV